MVTIGEPSRSPSNSPPSLPRSPGRLPELEHGFGEDQRPHGSRALGCDGSRFHRVGEAATPGTGTAAVACNYLDCAAAQVSGLLYYRLWQVGQDGTATLLARAHGSLQAAGARIRGVL